MPLSAGVFADVPVGKTNIGHLHIRKTKMTRRMQKEDRVLKQDGKVFEIRDLLIDEQHRSDDYFLSRCDVATISPTGHLVIFKLRPVAGNAPSFVGRWDGGSRDTEKQERHDLDIDIEGVPDAVEFQFKKGKGGYSGHHSTNVHIAAGRAYRICIRTPQGLIFEGTVSFTVHRKMELAEKSDSVTSVGIQKRQSVRSMIRAVTRRIFAVIGLVRQLYL